jgi:hypothetical protein
MLNSPNELHVSLASVFFIFVFLAINIVES